jgi:hypothetical protein
MKAYLALVLAILGIVMFSVGIWMQRIWLPQVRTSQPEPAEQAVSIEPAPEETAALVGSEPEEEWAADPVLLK